MKKASVALGNRRLLALAAFLRTIPRKRFDYTHWVGEDWKGNKNLTCGTSACALGWATVMPRFRRLGLELVNSATCGGGVVRLGRRYSTGAAEVLFGLDTGEAYDIFIPSDYEFQATPKQVAKKIERFVQQHQREAA